MFVKFVKSLRFESSAFLDWIATMSSIASLMLNSVIFFLNFFAFIYAKSKRSWTMNVISSADDSWILRPRSRRFRMPFKPLATRF